VNNTNKPEATRKVQSLLYPKQS